MNHRVEPDEEDHLLVDITAPAKVTLDLINAVLDRLNLPLLDPQELTPLKAA